MPAVSLYTTHFNTLF